MDWTKARRAYLRRHFRDGQPLLAIAAGLETTPRRVLLQAERMGLSRQGSKPDLPPPAPFVVRKEPRPTRNAAVAWDAPIAPGWRVHDDRTPRPRA